MIDFKEKNIKNSNGAGFTLIEAVLYLAIVAILLTAAVSFHLILGGTSDKLSSNILTSRNRRVAMSAIGYLIKNSDGMLKDTSGDCSNFSTSPDVLALYFEDDTYLPGTCVIGGGGVRITVSSTKAVMSCYPNMSGNGWYNNCSTSTYPLGNFYDLTSSNVIVSDSSLSFTTSTATSTANEFISITTNLSVGTQSRGQVSLMATSTATSTVILKNGQPSGLISWWSLTSGSGTDQKSSNNISCGTAPANVNDLLSGTASGAWDFESLSSHTCTVTNDDSLNFSNAFSITAWVNEESTGVDRAIINKSDATTKKGYALFLDLGYPTLRIYNSNSYTDYASSFALVSGTTYHIAATYDLNNDEVILYVYQKAVGGKATTTVNSLLYLVNYNSDLSWSASNYFDGIIDDVRLYNRTLTKEEVWALQSQGAS